MVCRPHSVELPLSVRGILYAGILLVTMGCQVEIPGAASAPSFDGSMTRDGDGLPDASVTDDSLDAGGDLGTGPHDALVSRDTLMSRDAVLTRDAVLILDGVVPVALDAEPVPTDQSHNPMATDGTTQDSPLPDAMPSAPFYGDWQWRAKLRIDQVLNEEVLDIPLFIELPLDQLNINEDRLPQELRFVDAQGNLLAHNIERLSNGQLDVWVRLARLPEGEGSFIWAYWGNPLAGPPQNEGFFSESDLVFIHFGQQAVHGEIIENLARPEHPAIFDRDKCDVRAIDHQNGSHLHCRGLHDGLSIPSLSGDRFPAQGFTLLMSYETSLLEEVSLLADDNDDHEQYVIRGSQDNENQLDVLGLRARREVFGPVSISQDRNALINHIMLTAVPARARVLMNGDTDLGLRTIEELVLGPGGGFIPTGQQLTLMKGRRGELFHVHLVEGSQSIEWARIYQLALMGMLFTVEEAEPRP